MDEELKTYLEGMENRLVQRMHEMESALLGAFESFSVSQTVRLRKLEEDQSTSEFIGNKRHCP